MKRSRLKNKANKSGKEEDKRLYNIQRNKVSKLNNKLKKTYFKEKLPKGNNVKDFWNYCKPYFTNKGICNDDRIVLVEKDKILNKDSDISETFNNYFVNITKDLGIFDWADDSLIECLVSLTILLSKRLRININNPLISNLISLVLIMS